MSRFVAVVLIAFIRSYRLILPVGLGCCRFRPTCSQYAWQAITVYGPWKGTWMAARRIARCNPLASGGWDPV